GVTATRLELEVVPGTWQEVPLIAGYAELTGLHIGSNRVRGTAWDAAGNQGMQIVTLTVNDHGRQPPQVQIDNVPSTPVTEPVLLHGFVSGPDISAWYVRLTPTAGGPSIPIASGSQAFSGNFGLLDPTLVPDGAYYLQIHADSAGGEDGLEYTV